MDPVTVYDTPGLVLKQIMDGEFDPSVIGNSMFRPDRLGPDERDVIGQRLRNAAGESSMGRAMANVVTNPWVWLFFLTTPAVARGGTNALFSVAKEFQPAIRKGGGFLANRGFLTNAMVTRGSDAQPAAFQIDKLMRHAMNTPRISTMEKRMAEVIRDAGLDTDKGFAWREYAASDPRREVAFRLSSAVHGTIEKWDKLKPGRVRPVLDEANGKVTGVSTAEEENLFRLGRDPREELRKFTGAEELVTEIQGAIGERASLLYSGGEKSAARILAGLGAMGGSSQPPARITRYLQKLLRKVDETTDPVKKAAATGRFEKAVRTAMIDPVQQNGASYFPRNIADTFVDGQRQARPMTYDALPAATTSKRNVSRSGQAGIPYDPEELRMLRKVYGGTPELDEAIKFADGYVASKRGRNEAYKLWAIDPFRSVQRYFDQTARDYAMFVGDIGDEVRAANRTTRHADIKPQPNTLKSHRGGGAFTDAIEDIEAGAQAPYGGFSLGDVFNGAWATSPDKHFRSTIKDSIVPHIMGRIRPEYGMTIDAINLGKKMAGQFASTGAAKAIAGGSKWGDDFVKQLEGFAESETTVGQAGGTVRGIARTLYAGHLGLNASSAVINMTQPFIFAGSWVGYKNVLKGYADAFAEMGAYVNARSKQGFRPLAPVEKRALQEQHFSFVTKDEDFLGIADTAEELLEGFTLNAETHASTPLRGSRLAFDYVMKGFEKAEHMNRLVTAHALKHAHVEKTGVQAASGTLLGDQSFRSTLREFVQETQFGSHWMNTPQIFMPKVKGGEVPGGGWMSNQLIRQFLSFPLRSFVAAVHTSPRLAARQGMDSWMGFANDAVRGMAASAVLYEVGKGLVGADLSRAGYAAAVTDVLPGFSQGRFTGQEGPIPIPPVVDIPYNVVKGVLGDDMELVRQNLARAVPGGIALSRAMGVLPEAPMGLSLLQKTHADWRTRTPEGLVPIYKPDGSLIDYQEPVALLARGMGLDFGATTGDQKLVQALLSNREEANALRKEAIAGLLMGDKRRVSNAQRDYQRKFKVPLKVSKEQLRSASRMRTTTRVERVLDSLPADIRPRFTEIVAQKQGSRTGMDPAAFEAANTSRERDAQRPAPAGSFGSFDNF